MADENNQEELDYLSLSDEEIANLEYPTEPEENQDDEDTTDEEDTQETEDEVEDETDDETTDEDDVDESEETDDTEDETSDDDGDSDDENSQDDQEEETSEDDDSEGETDDETDKSDDTSDSGETDYKAIVEAIFAPFKANGREMQVDNPEDVIHLMQQGANYNKKMAALKPHLKLLKKLENNELLEEDKLNFAIDLMNKNEAAIAKLVSDSKIDPLSINTENASDYKSETYTVDDREIDLDLVLADIKDTQSYATTIDVISNKWDESSKRVLFDQPDAIRVINSQVADGTYDKIANRVEKERALGRLNGLSDIDAYMRVGQLLQSEGNLAAPQQANQNHQSTPNRPAKKQKDNPQLNKKRRAAASTKSSKKTPKKDVFGDVLGMSDEEFAKAEASKFR